MQGDTELSNEATEKPPVALCAPFIQNDFEMTARRVWLGMWFHVVGEMQIFTFCCDIVTREY